MSSAKFATPLRGEVYWVDFNPVIGSEQGNRRPGLIVSPNSLNKIPNNHTVSVLPITSHGTEDPVRMFVDTGEVKGMTLIQQVRVLDKRRLESLAGSVDPARMQEILLRLRQFFT